MGILGKVPLKRKDSTLKVVFSEDVDVGVPPHRKGCGWFPVSEALSVGPGATVVTIKTIGADPRAAIRDIPGKNLQYLSAARAGVADCSEVEREANKSLADACQRWLEALAIAAPNAVNMLGLRILNYTDGVDVEAYYSTARVVFGVPEEGSEGATKSPDGGA